MEALTLRMEELEAYYIREKEIILHKMKNVSDEDCVIVKVEYPEDR